jgi:hypothetical protein
MRLTGVYAQSIIGAWYKCSFTGICQSRVQHNQVSQENLSTLRQGAMADPLQQYDAYTSKNLSEAQHDRYSSHTNCGDSSAAQLRNRRRCTGGIQFSRRETIDRVRQPVKFDNFHHLQYFASLGKTDSDNRGNTQTAWWLVKTASSTRYSRVALCMGDAHGCQMLTALT